MYVCTYVCDRRRDISKFDAVLTSFKLEQLTTKILKQNVNRHKRIGVVGQKHQTFWEFRAPFPRLYMRQNPRSMYERV